MAIIQGNAKQGSTRGFYPKTINGSLRFNDDDSAYLSWTPASAGNRKTWTYSVWVKRANLVNSDQTIISANTDANNRLFFYWQGSGIISFYHNIGGSAVEVATSAVFRDPSAWYHFVIKADTTQATASDRLKFYVNGVEQTLTATTGAGYVPQNTDTQWNNNVTHYIGKKDTTATFYDGYYANVHFIDGQALTASDFGETKNGVWVAKDYAGTFGTNGFYLTFEDDTQVEAFNTVLVNGSNKSQKVTGYGFAPDLLWFKNRTSTGSNFVVDTVRGTGKALGTDLTNAEFVGADKEISFDSDGFTTPDGVTGNMTGDNGQNYVVWGWKAGDSNVSNTDGTITSTVRANDTYGFSIVSYTGSSTAGTIGHGLSSAPDFILTKPRTSGIVGWCGYHSSLGETKGIFLELTNAAATVTDYWNNTAPTSSVFSVGGHDRTSGSHDYIAYCWSETTGYSKFGSYTGNGSTSGPVVTGLGFTPAWVMIKRTDDTGGWEIWDNTRDVVNPIEKTLQANSSAAELTSGRDVQFDSDGFTIKNTTSNSNASGGTYIYAAFADTREAAFWLDQSGNDNDWQPVNLDHNDTVADSPTNNFATLNPLSKNPSRGVLSDGNLKYAGTDTNWAAVISTIGVSSGQFYAEFEFSGSVGIDINVGIQSEEGVRYMQDTDHYLGKQSVNFGYRQDGKKVTGAVASTYGSSFTNGDTIGVALDMDAGTVTFTKNGVSQGVAFSGLSGTYFIGLSTYKTGYANFGQQPFKYDPPA